jgi:serine phosphatase RsbU (regulator of sigma subunit)
MSAVVTHWDPATRLLTVANCGHVPPVVIRNDGSTEKLKVPKVRGLGGRAAPEPAERSTTLNIGDRLIMVSDGVVAEGKGKAGLGLEGLLEAAAGSQRTTAPSTVRAIHSAVLEASGGELEDDATAVCLAITAPR